MKEGERMATLVVYYSNTGSTAAMAESLAAALAATPRRLVEANPRKGMTRLAMGALLNLASKLQDPDFSTAGFDLLALATPVWAGHLTPAMRSVSSGWEGKAD
jgi:flavodoxin